MSAFVTIADYETAFGVSVTGNAELEAQVQFALDSACAEIRAYLSQDLDYTEDDVIVLDGTGHQTLLLPQLPVVAVNSVFIDKGEDTEEEVADYVIGFGGILNRRAGWPWAFGNITVDYDHGYGAYEGIELPADLKNAALNIARSVANPASVESLTGITSESIGGYSYTRDLGAAATTIDVSVYSRTLDRYQVKRIPVP